MAASSSSDGVDLEKGPPWDGNDGNSSNDADFTQKSDIISEKRKPDDRTKGHTRRSADEEEYGLKAIQSRHENNAGREESGDGGDQHDSDDEAAPSEVLGDEQPGVVGRVLSRVTSRSSYDPGPPPDGGLVAWTQCKYTLLRSWKTFRPFSQRGPPGRQG